MINNIRNANIFRSNAPQQQVEQEKPKHDGYFITNKIADDIFEAKEQEHSKKSKKIGIIVSSTTVGAALLILGLTKGMPKNTYKVLNNYLHKVKDSTLLNKQKITEKLTKYIEKSQSINNITSLKDLLVMKLMQRSKFAGKLHEATTKVFEKMAQKTVSTRYKSAQKYLNRLTKAYKNAGVVTPEAKAFSEKLNGVTTEMEKNFSKEAQNMRFHQVSDNWTNLADDVLERSFNGIMESKSVKDGVEHIKTSDVGKVFIAEDILAARKAAFGGEVNGYKQAVETELNELYDMSKDKLSKKDARLIKFWTKLTNKKLDKAVKTETDEFFDKLRDLKLGSAPTDVITILGSLATVGIGLSRADNKDERISATLKYGVPVLGGIVTSLLMTISLVSGFKSMAIGTASGLIMNELGDRVDKARRKNNKRKEDIIHSENVKAEIAKNKVQKEIEKLESASDLNDEPADIKKSA